MPESRHDAIVAFSHGHPLSLALVGELGKHGDFDPSGSPDVLGSLLERLLSDVPGPSYRDAVYAGAQVRVTDEGVLAALLDGDVTAGFDWLRRQPYMESGLDQSLLTTWPATSLTRTCAGATRSANACCTNEPDTTTCG